MNNTIRTFLVCSIVLAAFIWVVPHPLSAKSNMVAISADIVEISGSLSDSKGFAWNELFEFGEVSIPGIIHVGDFQRKTGLAAKLRLLEEEGKAQTLSNPKVIAKSGTQANFVVGGEQPFPYATAAGAVGVDFKKFGVILNVLPVIIDEKKGIIDIQLQLEVSNLGPAIMIENTPVPSIVTRQIQTEVELKSGETLVIGGLKSSDRSVTKKRIPILGRIPLLGLLFRTRVITETQRSLFLFITVDIVK